MDKKASPGIEVLSHQPGEETHSEVKPEVDVLSTLKSVSCTLPNILHELQPTYHNDNYMASPCNCVQEGTAEVDDTSESPQDETSPTEHEDVTQDETTAAKEQQEADTQPSDEDKPDTHSNMEEVATAN